MSFLVCLPLVEADIPAVLDLDQRCLGGLWTRSGYQRELESPHSDLLVLATVSADISALAPSLAPSPQNRAHTDFTLLGVGCLWAILEEAHITTLAIEPAHQGRKLGQLLLTELLLQGHRRGLTRATLEVRASNERALSLYQKLSFKEAGQRKRYYSNGENARILWRSGLQSEGFLSQVMAARQAAITHLSTQYKTDFFTGFFTGL